MFSWEIKFSWAFKVTLHLQLILQLLTHMIHFHYLDYRFFIIVSIQQRLKLLYQQLYVNHQSKLLKYFIRLKNLSQFHELILNGLFFVNYLMIFLKHHLNYKLSFDYLYFLKKVEYLDFFFIFIKTLISDFVIIYYPFYHYFSSKNHLSTMQQIFQEILITEFFSWQDWLNNFSKT